MYLVYTLVSLIMQRSPILSPLGFKASYSPGTVFLFTDMETSSNMYSANAPLTFCSVIQSHVMYVRTYVVTVHTAQEELLTQIKVGQVVWLVGEEGEEILNDQSLVCWLLLSP